MCVASHQWIYFEIVTYSRRPTLSTDDAVARREGVGLALDVKATASWRMAVKVWRPVSSRVIMAKLKWIHWRQQKSDLYFVNIVCAYASTAKASPPVKLQVLEQLLDTQDGIIQGNTVVLPDDFNARVGMFYPADGLSMAQDYW